MKIIDIERLLREDSIEKRKAGRGESHRASRKKGFKGSVKFPVDFLRGKERRKYMGEETTLRIVTLQEYKDSEKEQQIKMMRNLLEKYSRNELAGIWGVSLRTLQAYLAQLGEKMPKSRPKRKTNPNATAIIESGATPTQFDEPVMLETFPPIVPKFSVSLALCEKGKDLQYRLRTVLATLLRDKHYRIEMILSESEMEEEPGKEETPHD
jgi:hypothetical protein